MGAGILPTTIHNGKLYFLFGKEGKYEDSAPGFSDFGGGTDNSESFIETAVREAGEEFTGFLGNDADIRKLLRSHGTYDIDHKTDGHKTYRMHIFPFEYNEWLPHYYNNNQRFLQKRLPPKVFKTTKIFEKAEIRWVCVDDLKKMRPQFRSYFQNIVDMMLNQKESIKSFIHKNRKKSTEKKTLKTRTKKTRGSNKKTIKRHKGGANTEQKGLAANYRTYSDGVWCTDTSYRCPDGRTLKENLNNIVHSADYMPAPENDQVDYTNKFSAYGQQWIDMAVNKINPIPSREGLALATKSKAVPPPPPPLVPPVLSAAAYPLSMVRRQPVNYDVFLTDRPSVSSDSGKTDTDSFSSSSGNSNSNTIPVFEAHPRLRVPVSRQTLEVEAKTQDNSKPSFNSAAQIFIPGQRK